jgi:hypothetical protein
MLQIVTITADGDPVFWTADSQAAPRAHSLWMDSLGSITTHPVRIPTISFRDFDFGGLMDVIGNNSFGDVHEYCRARLLRVTALRRIAFGEIFFAHSDRTIVVKQQNVDKSNISVAITSGPCGAELSALVALKNLMGSQGVAPVFCELIAFEVFKRKGNTILSTSLEAYGTDVCDWFRGDGRDPQRICVLKPELDSSAEPGAAWVVSRCAGFHLASSTHASDRVLFNDILRATIFQVFLGLAQGQRHCLFTHNDLWLGNVMFEAKLQQGKRLFVTGCGVFMLPKHSPQVRIIDFQHACFDAYSSCGMHTGRVVGFRDDIHNAFSLCYDTWRFSEYILLELLQPYYTILDQDLLVFLWRLAHFPGQPGAAPPARSDDAVHWKPYLTYGTRPEEALKDGVFDRFRCPIDTPADNIVYEKMPPQHAQERYLCAVSVLDAPPCNVPTPLFPELLRVFAENYEGTMIGRANLMHRHSPQARANFLVIELVLLGTILDHLWSEECAEEVAKRTSSPLAMCSFADAISVVVHADWLWMARPDFMRPYSELVLLDLDLPCVRSAARRQARGRPFDASKIKPVVYDSDIENFRTLFKKTILG